LAPSPRDIVVDALAAALLLICTFGLKWLEQRIFGDDIPWLVAAMLLMGELTLAFGFLAALISGFSKVRRVAAEAGVTELVRGLVALRPDRALLSLAGRVFGNSAAVGASLGVTCGALALCILLIANATKDAREQWFFYGLYAVVGGTLGVILFGRVEGAIMDKMKTSFCGFTVMFFLVVVGGVLIWAGLGLGEIHERIPAFRTLISWLAPGLVG